MYQKGPLLTRRWIVRGSYVALVAAVLAGAYLLGAHHHHPSSSRAPRVSPVLTGPVPVVPSTDPRQSAIAWLRGYRGTSYTDPEPWSWTTRVLPVLTDPLATEYRGVQGAGGGAEWTDYVARHCATTVTGPAAVIPTEAPHNDTEVYAEVSGDAVSTCAVADPPGGSTEHVGATLELLRGPDELWRVARRVY